LYNRFDNRLYRVNKHPTGCQTGLTAGLTAGLYQTLYVSLHREVSGALKSIAGRFYYNNKDKMKQQHVIKSN